MEFRYREMVYRPDYYDFHNDDRKTYPDMDGDFAYIAGYTPGGAPYGVRWEDVGIDSELPFDEKVRLYMDQMKDRADTLPLDDVEELPFD